MSRVKQVHIVIGGGRTEHIPVGLKALKSDSIHVITSTKFEEMYRKKMEEWSGEFDLESGLLIAIPTGELFSNLAADKIRRAMNRICEEEGAQFPLMDSDGVKWDNGVGCRFMVNITGGTNLMGGSAVHAAGTIGATCYYVSQGQEEDDGFPIMFPSMGLTAVLSQYDAVPMNELLERPTGMVDDLKSAGSLVLDLCVRGLASIQEEGGGHYEVSEEAKRLLFQTIQNRKERGSKKLDDIISGMKKIARRRGIGSEERGEGDEFAAMIASFPAEKCSNVVFKSFLNGRNLEARAEIWDGKRDARLRIYFAERGEPEGGVSWDCSKDKDSKIWDFRERWYSKSEAVEYFLGFARNQKFIDDKKASGAVARVLAGESEVEIFSMLARFNFKGLGFDVSGSLTSPVED